jgi:hypothetical protein
MHGVLVPQGPCHFGMWWLPLPGDSLAHILDAPPPPWSYSISLDSVGIARPMSFAHGLARLPCSLHGRVSLFDPVVTVLLLLSFSPIFSLHISFNLPLPSPIPRDRFGRLESSESSTSLLTIAKQL